MSLNSKERCYFEGFEENFQTIPELHWQTAKAYSVDLAVNEDMSNRDVLEAEGYPFEKVIKVSDPLRVSDPIDVNSRYSVEGLRIYRDRYQSSIIILYNEDSLNEIRINSPSVLIGEDYITQAYKVLQLQESLKTFQGIYQGLYKGKTGVSHSPTIRSIGSETVRTPRTVQVSVQNQEQFLFGFNYYPFPRSVIDNQPNLSDPKTVAHGLYFLISKGEDQKIVGLLSQISHYYLDLVKAKPNKEGYEATAERIPGFPNRIFRWDRGLHTEVDLEQNLYLGLAIVDSLLYLYNRPRAQQVELMGLHNLESKLKFLLDQIVFLLRSVSEEGKSLPSQVLKEEGYASQSSSLTSAYIGSIFLTHCLQINYSLESHTLACNFYDLLKKLPWGSPRNFQTVEAIDKDSFKSDFAQILWMLYFGINNPDIDESLGNRLQFLEESDLSDFPQEAVFFLGFYQALYPEISYPNGDLLSDRPFVQAPTKGQNEELYSVGSNQPYLVDQCYGGFINTDYLFFREIKPFPLLSEELNLVLSKLYKEQVRVTPKGEEWFSQKSLFSSESVIGSLLLSSAQSFKSSVLRYLTIKLGLNPSSAVGFMMSKYSRIYLEKSRFQGDTYWNQLLDQYLNTDNSQNSSIESITKRIADPNHVLENPKPYYYKTEDEEGNVVDKVFYPQKDISVSELVSEKGIVELMDMESDLLLSDIDLFLADSDQFLWGFMDEPIYEEEGTLGNPYITVPPSKLLGYIQSKGVSHEAVEVINNLVPAGIHYRQAILNLAFRGSRNRSLNSFNQIKEVT